MDPSWDMQIKLVFRPWWWKTSTRDPWSDDEIFQNFWRLGMMPGWFWCYFETGGISSILRLFQHTELEHTPKKTFTNRL